MERSGRRVWMLLWVAPAALFGLWEAGRLIWGWAQPNPTYADVDLKAMGQFLFDDRRGVIEDVPAPFRRLDGKRIKVEGFLYISQSAPAELQIVHSFTRPWGNGPPRVQERIFGTMSPSSGIPIYDSSSLVQVSGVLHVSPVRDESGMIVSLYRMDVESVVPAPAPAPVAALESPFRPWHALALGYLPAAILTPLRWRTASRRRTRILNGLCPACRYDLRATPERCPECGAVAGGSRSARTA